MKIKHRVWGYVVLGIISIMLFYLGTQSSFLQQFTSPEFIRNFIISFGVWSYLAYIVLLLLTVPLPIPSTPVVLGGGIIFGTVVGTILSLLSVVIGASIAFQLVRKFGRPLLEKLVDKHHLEHFEHTFKKRKETAALISYAVPIFPSDMVSLFLGLTKMKYTTFIVLVILGHIPRFLLINSLGEDLFSGFTVTTIFIVLGSALFVFIAIFRRQIRHLFLKELKKFK
ncbi:hypothetical protein CL620_03500 [archaeon]|nr:hypothetical protein [archaeon]